MSEVPLQGPQELKMHAMEIKYMGTSLKETAGLP
jgi:hypothetical protein